MDRLTAWYIRRHPELREYYESMLLLEIELLFADPPPQDASQPLAAPADHAPQRSYRLLVTTAAALALLLALTLLLTPKSVDPTPEPGGHETAGVAQPGYPTHPDNSNAPQTEVIELPRIDLGDLLVLAAPLSDPLSERLVEWGNPFDRSPLRSHLFSNDFSPIDLPVRSVADFSEKPLESTLYFLESAQILHRRSSAENTLEN